MSMADRIILMREGRVEKEGSAEELYGRPATLFAARFIGTPAMNLVALDDGADGAVIRGSQEPVLRGRGAGLTLGVRPEHLRLVSGGEQGNVGAEVKSAEYHGADTVVEVRVGQETLFVRAPGQLRLAPGSGVRIGWDAQSVHLFESSGGGRIDPGQKVLQAA